jgi:hypothetical protein
MGGEGVEEARGAMCTSRARMKLGGKVESEGEKRMALVKERLCNGSKMASYLFR